MATITSNELRQDPELKVVDPLTDEGDLGGTTQSNAEFIAKLTADSQAKSAALEKAETQDRTSVERILEGMVSLEGKEADIQAAETATGVGTETEAFNKLSEELRGLSAESAALVRESQAIPLKVQQEAAGTGATDVGVAPITTGRLRENAIRSLTLASRADVVAANLTNSKIRLDAAKDKAQRAVDLKYKPIENRLATLKANLELNFKYITQPAEKKALAAEKIRLDRQTKELDEEKDKDKMVQNLLIDSAGIAPDSVMEQARAIADKGGTLSEVAQALGKYSETYIDFKVKQANLSKIQAENAAHAAAIKAAESGTGVSFAQLTEKQQDTTLKLRKEYNNESKDFIKIRDAYNRILASAVDPSAAGDLALIFNYMKVLDPGSTVREGEFATAQNSAGIPNILRAKYNKIITGERLADETRVDFVNRSTKLFEAQQSQQQKINNNFDMLSSSAGIPSEFVTRDISSAMTSDQETLDDNWENSVPDPSSPTTILDELIRLNSGVSQP